MKSGFYKDELTQMKDNYNKNPLNDIKLPCPKWLDSNDPMFEIYSKKSLLLQQGNIAFAHIVQANTILFQRFPPFNCPAHIIYSVNKAVTENPEILFDIATELYSYKGKPENEIPDKWKNVAKVIKDEYDRSDFTFNIEAYETTAEYHMLPIMVFRKLLPGRRLCGNLIPILFAPDCKQVLILPKKYWSKNFTKLWVQGKI